MFESKLREALELATQKSAAGRVKAMEAICGAFLKRYCPDFVENQQVKHLSTQIIQKIHRRLQSQRRFLQSLN